MKPTNAGRRHSEVRVSAGCVFRGLLLMMLVLAGMANAQVMSNTGSGVIGVSVAEQMLVTQSGANAVLKLRLKIGVTAQVWGDTTSSCSSVTGSLTQTSSGAYTIPLNTIPFGTNQNNYVCARTSDSALSSNVVWPHTAASLAFVQGTGASYSSGAVIAPSLTVRVLDSFGTLITSSTASITMAIGTNPGSGTLAGTVTRAAVNGIATFDDLSIAATGTGYTLVASSTGLTSATSSSFNILAGLPPTLQFQIQPSNVTAGNAISPSVKVKFVNSLGTTITSITSTVTITISGSGTFAGSSTLSVAAVSGVATFSNLIPTTSGSYTLTAASSGSTSATSNSFTVAAGTTATKLLFGIQPSAVNAGSAITPAVTVRVTDAYGNTLTGNTSAVTIGISSGGVLAGSSTLTVNAVAGVATFSNLVPTAAGAYTLAATDGALTGATSSSFTVSPSTVNKLVFGAQPANVTAGNAITPSVTVSVTDVYGNLVTTSTASITTGFTSGGTWLTGSTLTVNAVSGVASFTNLKPTTSGAYTLTASSSGLPSVASNSFTVSAAAASKLAFGQQPSTTARSSVITPAPTVLIQDLYGNTVTTSNTNVTMSTTSTLTGGSTKNVQAVNGVATFSNLKVSSGASTGSRTLTASSSGLTSITSSAFTVQ